MIFYNFSDKCISHPILKNDSLSFSYLRRDKCGGFSEISVSIKIMNPNSTKPDIFANELNKVSLIPRGLVGIIDSRGLVGITSNTYWYEV